MLRLTLAAAFLAAAASPTSVEDGIRLYEGLQFERAALVLKKVAADSTLSDAERAKANLYLGLASSQLLDDAGAREAFARAAELDPRVRLPPGVSPKVERVFRQALDIAAKRAVHLEVVLPTGAANTELVPVEVRTTPPGRVDTVRLFVRREGDDDYRAMLLDPAGGGVFRGKVQARTPALELYVEADAEGARRGLYAAADAPARLPVSGRVVFIPPGQGPEPPKPPATPVYKQWWLYAGIAVVLAGAGVAAYFATRPLPCGASNGNGCVWITINNP